MNLLSELRKRDKMPGLPSTLSHFGNEFDIFNNTGARMLDSIYHMTLKIFFCVKKSRSCHLLCNVIMGVIALRY